MARSLDAFVTKTVTPLPRDGNYPVRIAETDVGMSNSIGLANPGIDRFLGRNLPQLEKLGVTLWVSVGGFETDHYSEICSRLDDHAAVSAIELNVSCPNVDAPAESTAQIVAAARLATRKQLWAKLSPAVPDIGEVAKAAQASGADGLSLVNTIRGTEAGHAHTSPRARTRTRRALGTGAEADRARSRRDLLPRHHDADCRNGRHHEWARRARVRRSRCTARRSGNRVVRGPRRTLAHPDGAARGGCRTWMDGIRRCIRNCAWRAVVRRDNVTLKIPAQNSKT